MNGPAAKSGPGPANVLICGAIRDQDALASILENIGHLRLAGLAGRVVLSTWIGQPALTGPAADLARALDLELAESAEPRIDLFGHTLHQMKQLHVGLGRFAPDDPVLKVRTDKMPASVDFAAAIRQWFRLPPSRIPVFRRRIWAMRLIPVLPTFLHDVYFMGLAADLGRLVSYDLWWEMEPTTIITEQIFHSAPWVHRLPWVRPVYAASPGFGFAAEGAAGRMIADVWLASPLVLRAIHDWLCIVRDGYHLGLGSKPRRKRLPPLAAMPGATLRRMLASEPYPPIPGMGYSPGFRWTEVSDHERVKELLALPVHEFGGPSLLDLFGGVLDDGPVAHGYHDDPDASDLRAALAALEIPGLETNIDTGPLLFRMRERHTHVGPCS